MHRLGRSIVVGVIIVFALGGMGAPNQAAAQCIEN